MRIERRARPSVRDERGFTIVEVLIAALVVTCVFAGAVYFIVGAGKTQQRTLVRQRMAATADGLTQQVRADRNWLTAVERRSAGVRCDARGVCDITKVLAAKAPSAKGPKLTSKVTVQAIDSAADLRGDEDQDGLTDDYYHVAVVVSLAPGEQQEWGKQKDFETVSTIDPSGVGFALGTLVVQVAETTNQVDERMAIPGARTASTKLPMNDQPSPCTNPFPLTIQQYALAPVFPLGCNDSINAARAKDQRAPENVRGLSSVNVRAVTNAPFTIERQTTSGGRRVKLDSSNAVYKGDGTYVFAGVPAGLYAVKLTPGKYRELWDTKSVPSQGMTSVQANQEARALMMLRPVQGVGEYTIRAERQVYLYHLETDTDSFTTTFQEFGATFETVTTFVYLIGAGPRKETWGGPAWNGFVSMSPKPFDRYRVPKTDGTTVNQQQSLFLGWDGKDTSGKFTFTGLPTGLHSSPRQQTNPVPAPDDFWGSIGSRAQNCAPARVPGGQCGDFAWIDHRAGSTFGAPASEIVFHSNDGECYLESNVPGYKLERSIQLGGEHARRCSRDFMYYNPRTKKTTRIKNFLPRKDGTGGGRMILSVSATTSCIADCGLIPPPPATATMGYQDPGPDSVRPATDPPPSTPVEKPKVTIVREKPTGGTQSYSSSAAPAAPLSGTTSNNTLASALTGKK